MSLPAPCSLHRDAGGPLPAKKGKRREDIAAQTVGTYDSKKLAYGRAHVGSLKASMESEAPGGDLGLHSSATAVDAPICLTQP